MDYSEEHPDYAEDNRQANPSPQKPAELWLTEVGNSPIHTIKTVKELTGLPLKDCKEIVDAVRNENYAMKIPLMLPAVSVPDKNHWDAAVEHAQYAFEHGEKVEIR